MNKKKSILVPILAIAFTALLLTVMLLVYFQFKPKAIEGSKLITVDVIIPNEETKEFKIHTDAEYLSQALEEQKLIVGETSTYGLFITSVNGRAADSAKNEWWSISKDSVDLNTGADATVIADGEHYEFTLKTY